jgi:acetyl-CoA C-acetyltransferase
MASQAYLVDGMRSPIGSLGGSLLPLRASEFGTPVARALLERTGVKPNDIEHIVAGMVLQDMIESNPVRVVGKLIGVPNEVASFTLNMQCCSGMQALILAAQQVALEQYDCVLALGLESMSNAPHLVRGARWGLRMGGTEFLDMFTECSYAGSKMWGDPKVMIDVAENHAEVDGIAREEMDAYAVISHNRTLEASEAGRFDDEIVPIEVPQRRGGAKLFERDEHPRPGISVEKLSQLPTVQPNGSITAGNAAGMNDGAAAALICNEKGLKKLGLDPLARFIMPGMAQVGCEPNLMGYSCVDALNAALKSAEMRTDDLDLIECNEGFAVQLVACQRQGQWSSDRLNVDGGSVGLGHPVGMSGLRIAIHLAHALKHRHLKRGGATIPAGSGLGTAVLLEAA